jgi:hypothetical protein
VWPPFESSFPGCACAANGESSSDAVTVRVTIFVFIANDALPFYMYE